MDKNIYVWDVHRLVSSRGQMIPLRCLANERAIDKGVRKIRCSTEGGNTARDVSTAGTHYQTQATLA